MAKSPNPGYFKLTVFSYRHLFRAGTHSALVLMDDYRLIDGASGTGTYQIACEAFNSAVIGLEIFAKVEHAHGLDCIVVGADEGINRRE